MTSAAIIGAANVIWRTKPSASPTSASAAAERIVVTAKMFCGGTIGCAARTRNPIAPDKVTRTVSGTDTEPNTGAAMNVAPMRIITNTSAQSCGSIERPKPSTVKSPSRSREGLGEGATYVLASGW